MLAVHFCHILVILQGAVGPQKPERHGSYKSFSKHSQFHHQRQGSRRHRVPSAMPAPRPVSLPYRQPHLPPVLPVVPPPYLPMLEGAHQFYTEHVPTAESPVVKSGRESPTRGFGPTGQGGGDSMNGSHMPHPQGYNNPYAGNFANRRPDLQGPGLYVNPTWHRPWGIGPRENVNMPRSVGPRAFIRPLPPVFGPAPGFIGRPGVHGKSGDQLYCSIHFVLFNLFLCCFILFSSLTFPFLLLYRRFISHLQ